MQASPTEEMPSVHPPVRQRHIVRDIEVDPCTSVHSLITSMNTAPIVASVDVRSDSQVCCATYLNESTAAIDWNSVLDLLTMMSQRTLPRWW